MTDENAKEVVSVRLTPAQSNEIVHAGELVGIYQEIMDDIREDREEIDKAYTNFADMVFNGGDPSQGSKEAMVNLLKMKQDAADKKSRVMELLLRAFLKENTPRHQVNVQHNEFRVDNPHRKLLEDVAKDNPHAKIAKRETR